MPFHVSSVLQEAAYVFPQASDCSGRATSFELEPPLEFGDNVGFRTSFFVSASTSWRKRFISCRTTSSSARNPSLSRVTCSTTWFNHSISTCSGDLPAHTFYKKRTNDNGHTIFTALPHRLLPVYSSRS